MRKKRSLIVVLVAWQLVAFGAAGAAAQKPGQPYALIAGTVFFEENGHLVRGAEVEVKEKDGKKHWRAKTDDAGEFAIRVPAGQAVYNVVVQFPGYQTAQKEVPVTEDERVDVVLHLAVKAK